MIALRDKKEHTRRRRPWTRGFSSVALKGYEPLIVARCQQLVEVLSNQTGAVDMSKWMGYFACVAIFISLLILLLTDT